MVLLGSSSVESFIVILSFTPCLVRNEDRDKQNGIFIFLFRLYVLTAVYLFPAQTIKLGWRSIKLKTPVWRQERDLEQAVLLIAIIEKLK